LLSPATTRRYPEFIAHFGDRALDNGGAKSQLRCFQILSRVLGQTDFANTMPPGNATAAAAATEAVAAFERSLGLWEQRPRSHTEFPRYCRSTLRPLLGRLAVGQSLLVPFGFGDAGDTVMVLQRTQSAEFSLAVISTNAHGNLTYHLSSASAPPKIKYRTALVVAGVEKAKLVDNDVFWATLFVAASQNTATVYDILLP